MFNGEIIFLIIFSIAIIYVIISKLLSPFTVRIRKLYEIKKSGKTTTGTIVDYETDKDASGFNFYLSVVEYQINNENIRTVIDLPLKEKPPIGSTITVYYDEKNTGNVIVNIEDAFRKSFIGVFFLSLVILLIIFFLIKKITP